MFIPLTHVMGGYVYTLTHVIGGFVCTLTNPKEDLFIPLTHVIGGFVCTLTNPKGGFVYTAYPRYGRIYLYADQP